MTLDKAITMLKARYEWAKEQSWIYNPLAYALYEVWHKTDGERKKND